jgi:uncharacterized protein DUF4114
MHAHLRTLMAVAVATVLSSAASAQTLSPFQSPYRPSGLPLAGSVYMLGTDSLSATLQANVPGYISMIKSKLPETVAFTGAGLNQLDPQRLYFLFSYAPRVYFLYEGACYTDALGVTIATVSAPTSKPATGTSYTVFPNGHSSISPVCASESGVRSATEPLLAGDFVQLPTVNAGQQLAFFLMSNLNSSGSTPANTFYNGSANNADGYQHLIAFFPDNSQYIIIGFEDMYGGGDKDCNDMMFAVDVGPNNAAVWRAPTAMPK